MPAPRATYRLQLHPGFGFADAIAAVPYLAELGISHLYLSPVRRAATTRAPRSRACSPSCSPAIRRVLALRAASPERFASPYRALAATGPHARRVFAFARGEDLVTVVPRLAVRAEAWRDTALALPAGRWRDALSGGDVDGGIQPVARLWRSWPIALLVRVAA